MWAELCRSQSNFEGFSPGTPAFFPQPKIDSQLIPSAVVLCSEVVDNLCLCVMIVPLKCLRFDLVEPRPRNSVLIRKEGD